MLGHVTASCDRVLLPQAYYYSAIVEDVLLRFSWTLTITLSTVVRFHGMADILATVLAPMEVFRYFSLCAPASDSGTPPWSPVQQVWSSSTHKPDQI